MDGHTETLFRLMRKESNRLKTFQSNPPWPKDFVDTKKLAKAGFFYAFSGDRVFCAFCRGQVCKWDRDDDPMSEHARHFSTCPFIMGGEVGNEPLGEDPFPGPKRPRPYDVCGIYNNTNMIENNNLTGSDNTNDSVNHHHHLRHNRTQSPSRIVEQQVHEVQERYSLTSSPRTTSPASSPRSSSPPTEYYSCTSPPTPSSRLAGAGSDPVCKVCYSTPIELVFLPCGHSVSCIACSRRLTNCPYCRVGITCRLRTYIV